MRSSRSRTLLTLTSVAALALTAACAGTAKKGGDAEAEREAAARAHAGPLQHGAMEKLMMIAGTDPNEAAKESKEAATLAEQYAQARTAPGVVDSGAYTAAYQHIGSMGTAGGSWADVTKKPYNSDDARYRDYYSNSSGGMGYVNGRTTGVAADDSGDVYSASADGGVWRSLSGGGAWQSMADDLPSLSSGFLTLAGDQSLWYASGEATTAADSHEGAGVFRVEHPKTDNFTLNSRVGGQELESATIGRIRFGGSRVWAATNRGVWWHNASTNSGDWHFSFAPNPDYMPEIKDDAGNILVHRGSLCTDNTSCGPTNAPYKNIVNDIAIDPNNASHVIAAIGWRSGDTYNGFYETKNGGTSWTKINPTGAIPANDIGYVTFGWAKDGSKLYAINQSPKLLNNGTRNANTVLEGVYVSNNGSVTGPWSKIADSTKLASSGSALKQVIMGKGYGPGVQAWYNQFLQVDPKNPNHVYLGLEEIYETKNAGSSWTTPGPYWNFYFPCWDISDTNNHCPNTSHPDQHAATIGTVAGVPTFFAGNDGGVYARPVNGKANADGHATDWRSLSKDGTMDGLQYYSVAWGADKTTGGNTMVISGGMQDNGTSNLFGVTPAGVSPEKEMGSGFGGDGGDSMANPADGCQQAQEYTGLSMYVTKNCNLNSGSTSPSTSTAHAVRPADPNPRFIAPFDQDRSYNGTWIAGGQDVWTQDKGYDITSGDQWTKQLDLGAPHQATAVAMLGGIGYVAWCGPCNNSGFTRGFATNSGDGKTWKQVTLPNVDGKPFPNRYIGGIGIDPNNNKHVYLAVSGFSRNFTEGPGAGVGHIFESKDGGATWSNITGNYPDVPTSSIKQAPNGALLAGSDLGAFYRAPGSTTWQRLGGNMPMVSVTDVEFAPATNVVYAATHGRGIWSIPLP